MSGLIWSGIGQGIANAGSTMGNYMMQSALQDDRQEERRREREEEAKRQAERDALYRRPADQQGAGRAGGDGAMSAADIGEGGRDEGMLARRAGMTVPELRAMRRYSETGDTEPFKRETNKVTTKDTGDPYNLEVESQIVKELPPGFEREARAKLQTLAKIEESYRLGGKYDDVTKGRRNQQEIDMSEAAIARPEAAGIIGQGMAAGAGKDIVGGDSNVTRNLFTGATSTTPVGESVISENKAQAGQASAAGRLSGARADALAAGEDPDVVNAKTADLARQVAAAKAQVARALGVPENEINSTIRSLESRKDSDPAAKKRLESAQPLIDQLDTRQREMAEWKPGKTKAKPAPAPAPGPGSAPAPAPAEAKKPPPIAEVEGAPAGSTIGAFVGGRGWEVKDKSGKVIGYVRK